MVSTDENVSHFASWKSLVPVAWTRGRHGVSYLAVFVLVSPRRQACLRYIFACTGDWDSRSRKVNEEEIP
jgi:hypothetical protein